MQEFVDQMNQTIRLSGTPRRIVSLVPSQTELLFELGLEESVVGITKFCIHPDQWFRNKKRVGGTKNVDFQKVKNLQPDLIIGNKEENEKANILELTSIAPIWMSDISNLEQAFTMMKSLGEILNKEMEVARMIHSIKSGFECVKQPQTGKKTVLYLIWKDPYLAAGKNTFIDDMIARCGWENFVHEDRYPEVILSEKEFPDFVFLSSEPYPFKEKHIRELEAIYPNSKIILVDGEMFSWYGSRLLLATNYFQELIDSL